MAATDQVQDIEVDWDFHARQSRALDILGLPECNCLLYGGAKGGGKTVLGCRWMFTEAMSIIDSFGLTPSQYPPAIGFLGRKRAVDFSKTTLETWKREIPSAAYRLNEQKHEIIIFETVKYHYGGFDDRAVVEKFNSAEYCRCFVDQAEELTEDEIAMLEATFRLLIGTKSPGYKMLLTANPAQCWLKSKYVKNPQGMKEGLYFLQALPVDNPYLERGYVERLQRVYKHRPELLEAYLKGSWDAVEGSDILIHDAWVEASHRIVKIGPVARKIVVADIARFGDDRTVIYFMEETSVEDSEVYGKHDTHYTSGKIAQMANKHKLEDGKPCTIVIDGDGIGGPVADNLRAYGFDVHEIHSEAATSQPDMFDNLRAEMWWSAGEKFANGEVANDYVDDELDRELTIPKYRFRNGKIIIESKDEIKKADRYGQSPDKADTYIYGLYGLQFARIPKLTSQAQTMRKFRRRCGSVSPMGL